MKHTTFATVFVTIIALIWTVGCGEPDRTEYRDDAAEEVCQEAEDCDNLDGLSLSGYDSYDECIVEERSRFNDLWPEDECGDGQIDPDAYDNCMDRARNFACDGGAGDFVSALDYCVAGEVCTN